MFPLTFQGEHGIIPTSKQPEHNKGFRIMAKRTLVRENIITTRTNEKITIENNEVVKIEMTGKTHKISESFWFDGSYPDTIDENEEFYYEEAYQRSSKTKQVQEIPEHVVTEILEWLVDEIGDNTTLYVKDLLWKYNEQKQMKLKQG